MGTVFLSGGYTQLHRNIILFCTLTRYTGKPVKAQGEGDWPQRTGRSHEAAEDVLFHSLREHSESRLPHPPCFIPGLLNPRETH